MPAGVEMIGAGNRDLAADTIDPAVLHVCSCRCSLERKAIVLA